MPKPADYPDWATSPADPASAIVAPPPSLVSSGWSPSQKPPAQNFNWWKRLVGLWVRWLEESIAATEAALDGRLDAIEGRIDLTEPSPNLGFFGITSTAQGVGSVPGVQGVGKDNGAGVYGVGGDGAAGVVGQALNGSNQAGVEGRGDGGASGVVGYGDPSASGFGVQGIGGGGSANTAGVRGYGGTGGGYGLIAEAGAGGVRAALRLVPQSTPPTSPETGSIYFDATTSKLRVYTGSAWVDLH